MCRELFDFNSNGELDAFDVAIAMEILNENEEKQDNIFIEDSDEEDCDF